MSPLDWILNDPHNYKSIPAGQSPVNPGPSLLPHARSSSPRSGIQSMAFDLPRPSHRVCVPGIVNNALTDPPLSIWCFNMVNTGRTYMQNLLLYNCINVIESTYKIQYTGLVHHIFAMIVMLKNKTGVIQISMCQCDRFIYCCTLHVFKTNGLHMHKVHNSVSVQGNKTLSTKISSIKLSIETKSENYIPEIMKGRARMDPSGSIWIHLDPSGSIWIHNKKQSR